MRVVIVDDSALFRNGLALLLTHLGVSVIDSVSTVEEFRAVVAAKKPDVAIIDIRLPPTFTDEGSRLAAEILAWPEPIAVLLLSQALESRIAGAIASDHARGFGYLLKDRVEDAESLVQTLQALKAGGTVLDAEVVGALLARRSARTLLDRLSEREHQVLELIASGYSNAKITERLTVSPKTIESHVASIFSKLDLPPEAAAHRRVMAVLRLLQLSGDATRYTPSPRTGGLVPPHQPR